MLKTSGWLSSYGRSTNAAKKAKNSKYLIKRENYISRAAEAEKDKYFLLCRFSTTSPEFLQYSRVSTKSQKDLEYDILKDKVVVIVGRSQLDIFDNEFVDHDIIVYDSLDEILMIIHIFVRHFAAQDLSPDLATEAVRTASFQKFLTQRRMIGREDF
jgi:hypothetical protein